MEKFKDLSPVFKILGKKQIELEVLEKMIENLENQFYKQSYGYPTTDVEHIEDTFTRLKEIIKNNK